ncbi:MAG: hypothetical protein Q8K58_06080 [Acidimicrobiales bacterium]|nr:hypothetical protein [Acidimicrobiales bacterium]
MTYSTGDDLDRTTSGRFVRNLALSLSGGALLTLLGASAAHAQDTSGAAAAGTDSAGTGAASTGDATATGNQANTNTTQTVTVSGNLGTIQVINQQANVSNTGSATANTGGNIAIGNSSDNQAEADQEGVGSGIASNTGTASNGSNGTASITTGNATATGNDSHTVINQTANGQAHGQLGGILVINQQATVNNSGEADANSGGNTALGNGSDNEGLLWQDAEGDGSLASNGGTATNSSDGKATINTGAASATGNKSRTDVVQQASGSAGGALGGLVVINQNANVTNQGTATANSGNNEAEGNESENDAELDQEAGGLGGGAAIGIAANNGEASNHSNGTGAISTGAATAIGNDSVTNVTQSANSNISGPGGGAIVTQNSSVLNSGTADANSGGNEADGNRSDNDADIDEQEAEGSGALAIGVVGNFGLAENTSDGTGTVSSGRATAVGNRSETNVNQSSNVTGGALNVHTQGNLVTNIGSGTANSGDNEAEGNESENDADVDNQDADLVQPGGVTGVNGQFAKAHNSSDGTASITTGDATAVGNSSETNVNQHIDPAGVVVASQGTAVINAGTATANSGGNFALGNASDNDADVDQDAEVASDNGGATNAALVGALVAHNDGEASNDSDGTATIVTGDATATGNESQTWVDQQSNGTGDGAGVIVNTQGALVVNAGAAAANSGGNFAFGNLSDNDADVDQDMDVLSDNGGDVVVIAAAVVGSNNGRATNASDGTATIHTGDATATGNRSATAVSQLANGDVDGLGGVINTQAAVVTNTGLGVANSGLNLAVGNASENEADLDQDVEIASDNGGDVFLLAFPGGVTGTNSGTASNESDGTAEVHTGNADATGNASATNLSQVAEGSVDGLGLVVNTQVGGVVNAGLGIANSGLNAAVGNVSDQDGGEGADLDQDIDIASNNGDDVAVIAAAVTGNNSGTASNTSDGTGIVHTGGAQAQGNVSGTIFEQTATGSVGENGLGAVINTQAGGVANLGAAVANSGLNLAVGNASENEADIDDQDVEIASENGGDVFALVAGPLTANNSGDASNTSDGTAKVKTGGALATGNASATAFAQRQNSTVDGLGIVVGTQLGGVVNAGAAVANTGLNLAVGNASENDADIDEQEVEIVTDNGGAGVLFVLGPVTGNNAGTASNSSDGEACVCTGNAVASGNVSSTTFLQDIDASTGGGAVVITTVGGVLNAGVGIANSGLNAAFGNISDNDADLEQDVDVLDGASLFGVGPQTATNSGEASNSSTGTGKVGSGNATARGNVSTTNFAQSAVVDGSAAFGLILGTVTNTGFGLANSGLNLGVGNDSENDADLEQEADGAGTVANSGAAKNESGGSGLVGNPDCEDKPVVAPPVDVPKVETPEAPEAPEAPADRAAAPGGASLPRTGGPLEAQAAVALMLLLAGFGLRRKSAQLS